MGQLKRSLVLALFSTIIAIMTVYILPTCCRKAKHSRYKNTFALSDDLKFALESLSLAQPLAWNDANNGGHSLEPRSSDSRRLSPHQEAALKAKLRGGGEESLHPDARKAHLIKEREQMRQIRRWMAELDKYFEYLPDKKREDVLDELERTYRRSKEITPRDVKGPSKEPSQLPTNGGFKLSALVFGLSGIFIVSFVVFGIFHLFAFAQSQAEQKDEVVIPV